MTPVEAESYDTGARFTNLEIIPIDITNASSLQQNFPALYRYIYLFNDTIDPFSFSYFGVNTSVEIWNSLPYEKLSTFPLGGIGQFWSFPENLSYEIEISTFTPTPFVGVSGRHTLIHVPPGLSIYHARDPAFIRVNQTGLRNLPDGKYVFRPDWLHPSEMLNTTVTVTASGMTIEYSERPSHWNPGLLHNLPVSFTRESWTIFVTSVQVVGVLVVGLIAYGIWKRQKSKGT